MTARNENEKHDYQFYQHKYKILAQELATITVGVTAESAVTPTVIATVIVASCALSCCN